MKIDIYSLNELPGHVNEFWQEAAYLQADGLGFLRSREWIEFLSPSVKIFCLSEESEIKAIAPVVLQAWQLPYEFIPGWTAWKQNWKVVKICGGAILGAEANLECVATLLYSIYEFFPNTQGVLCSDVKADSILGQFFKYEACDFLCWDLSGAQCHRLWHISKKSGFKFKNRRNKFNKLSKILGGPLCLFKITDLYALNKYWERIDNLLKGSWQYRLRGHKLSKGKFEDLVKKGWLRSYLLGTVKQDCAFVFGFVGSKTLFHEHTVYDRSFSQYSPGMLLLNFIYQDLSNEGGFEFIDFGEGNATWKKRFGNCCLNTNHFLIVKRGLFYCILFFLYRISRVTAGFIRQVGNNLKIKPKIKKILLNRGGGD